jgi:TonB family protein
MTRHVDPDPVGGRMRGPVRPRTARFELLSDAKPRWDTFGISFIGQCLIVCLLLLIPLIYTEKFTPAMRYYIMTVPMPRTEVLLPPPPPKFKAPPQPKVKIEEPPVEPPKVAKMVAPRLVAPVQPKPKPVDVSMPEVKPADFQAVKMELNAKQPPRPREPIKMGVMASTGSAAPATVNLPLNKVQTGGFGDPNGLPGPGDPNKRANIARQGSPALPPGPGYGNGTGGANGVRGTVASTGFGNGIANPPSGGSAKHGTVKAGGFSDASAALVEGPRKKADSGEATTPVNILEKPKPLYTEDARNKKIEGDVVVEVVFLASGQVQVNRVVSGLGHGLDEAALRAAGQIKFKPARRENQPVDFPARVRIEFRMAY